MRLFLFALALLGTFSLVRPAAGETLKTHDIPAGKDGTLEIATPADWTLVHTNLNIPGNLQTIELHSISNTVVIRLQLYSDAFKGALVEPSDAKMDAIVSNNAVQYLPISIEKTIAVEKLRGPAMTGAFVRLTDAGWTPVVKDEFHILTTGMFRCEKIWGTFSLLTNDKDGPSFNQGMEVIKSFRRKP